MKIMQSKNNNGRKFNKNKSVFFRKAKLAFSQLTKRAQRAQYIFISRKNSNETE